MVNRSAFLKVMHRTVFVLLNNDEGLQFDGNERRDMKNENKFRRNIEKSGSAISNRTRGMPSGHGLQGGLRIASLSSFQ